jgi:hypothetical protein
VWWWWREEGWFMVDDVSKGEDSRRMRGIVETGRNWGVEGSFTRRGGPEKKKNISNNL